MSGSSTILKFRAAFPAILLPAGFQRMAQARSSLGPTTWRAALSFSGLPAFFHSQCPQRGPVGSKRAAHLRRERDVHEVAPYQSARFGTWRNLGCQRVTRWSVTP